MQDMAIAGITWILVFLAISEIEWQHRRFDDPVGVWMDQHVSKWLYVIAGLLVPIIRHLMRFTSGRRHPETSTVK